MGTSAAVTAAPYILPLFGFKDFDTTGSIMHFMSGHAQDAAFGTGLAGGLQQAYSHIPLIGSALTSNAPLLGITAGAVTTIAATAIIGIGGMLLANWMEKREQPGQFAWSKVVRYGALATSILIGLPSILGGISVGVMFLSLLGGYGAANAVGMVMRNTLGATAMDMGASGMLSLLPHIFTCGLPLLPVGIAAWMGQKQAAKPTLELAHADMPVTGQPAQIAFKLIDSATGKPLGPEALSVTQTEKLHTMVVDQALRDYHHLHPQYDAQTGLFTGHFIPNGPGPYMAWNDFTPTHSTTPIHQRIDLPSDVPARTASILPTSSASVDGLSIHVATETPLRAGSDGMLNVKITDAQGRPATNLQPIMGAYGHLAGFSADGRHFIHSHPLTPIDQPLSDGTLQFHLRPEQAGMTKFFLQLQQDEKVITLPFVQAVQQSTQFAQRPAMDHSAHFARA